MAAGRLVPGVVGAGGPCPGRPGSPDARRRTGRPPLGRRGPAEHERPAPGRPGVVGQVEDRRRGAPGRPVGRRPRRRRARVTAPPSPGTATGTVGAPPSSPGGADCRAAGAGNDRWPRADGGPGTGLARAGRGGGCRGAARFPGRRAPGRRGRGSVRWAWMPRGRSLRGRSLRAWAWWSRGPGTRWWPRACCRGSRGWPRSCRAGRGLGSVLRGRSVRAWAWWSRAPGTRWWPRAWCRSVRGRPWGFGSGVVAAGRLSGVRRGRWSVVPGVGAAGPFGAGLGVVEPGAGYEVVAAGLLPAGGGAAGPLGSGVVVAAAPLVPAGSAPSDPRCRRGGGFGARGLVLGGGGRGGRGRTLRAGSRERGRGRGTVRLGCRGLAGLRAVIRTGARGIAC